LAQKCLKENEKASTFIVFPALDYVKSQVNNSEASYLEVEVAAAAAEGQHLSEEEEAVAGEVR